jgi:tRNA C32,U32 (ribose-2'-O)-methylase TrmJ
VDWVLGEALAAGCALDAAEVGDALGEAVGEPELQAATTAARARPSTGAMMRRLLAIFLELPFG